MYVIMVLHLIIGRLYMYNYDTNEFMSNLYEGVYIVDKNRKIVFWNSGSEQITGYSAKEVVNKFCYDNILKHVDKNGKRLCLEGCPLLDTLQTGKINENDVFLEHKFGYRIPVSVKTFPLYDDDQNIIASVEVFTDLRYKKDKYEENLHLKQVMQRDELTQVYNRRYLEFYLNQLLNEAKTFKQSFGILFIDIDHFKNVNDNYGHNVGDEVLKIISSTIQSNLRKQDLVGRWGGEEFIVVVKEGDINTLIEISERLRQLCKNSTYKDGKNTINVTISIGGSLYKNGQTIKELIEHADQNMYHSKNTGRDKYTIN